MRIHHVQIMMPRAREEDALAFYAGLLGLERIPKPADMPNPEGLWFRLGREQLHLGVQDGPTPHHWATASHRGTNVLIGRHARNRWRTAATMRQMLLLLGTIALTACALSHERARRDAATDSSPPMCAPSADSDRFLALGCDDPRVFELASNAQNVHLEADPCTGAVPTTTAFVPMGILARISAPNLDAACIRVATASPSAGVPVGTSWSASNVWISVPYTATDVTFEMIGIDRCGHLIHGERRVNSMSFDGPVLVTRSAERIRTIADGVTRTPITYATATSVFVGDQTVPAENAYDILPDVSPFGDIAWIEVRQS